VNGHIGSDKKLTILIVLLSNFVFFLSVILLFALVPGSRFWNQQSHDEVEYKFDQGVEAAAEPNRNMVSSLKNMSTTQILRTLAVNQKEPSNGSPIARLEIPAIDCEVIIVEGSGNDSMDLGAGHLEGTPLPGNGGNFAVAADRYVGAAPFKNLEKIKSGDNLDLMTTYGRFEYEVNNIFTVKPEDVQVLEPVGFETITLITTDPSGRLIVRGRLVQANLLDNT